jgi:hypothetical protein
MYQLAYIEIKNPSHGFQLIVVEGLVHNDPEKLTRKVYFD